jgi:hypothetical protein
MRPMVLLELSPVLCETAQVPKKAFNEVEAMTVCCDAGER